MILDPFLGAGTTMVAALKHGRQCIGIDSDPEAINATKLRLQHLDLDPPTAQEITKSRIML
jgi:DNA modification methylase